MTGKIEAPALLDLVHLFADHFFQDRLLVALEILYGGAYLQELLVFSFTSEAADYGFVNLQGISVMQEPMKFLHEEALPSILQTQPQAGFGSRV